MSAPIIVAKPGEFIRDELAARGWSQCELAEITGFSPQYINDLIHGRRDIGPRAAICLGAAFGTSAQLWMNLDASYQLHWWSSRIHGVDEIEQRAGALARRPGDEQGEQ